jgi:hypothetical protein
MIWGASMQEAEAFPANCADHSCARGFHRTAGSAPLFWEAAATAAITRTVGNPFWWIVGGRATGRRVTDQPPSFTLNTPGRRPRPSPSDVHGGFCQICGGSRGAPPIGACN